jgi:ribonucleoside-diphosphate reductase alpha chain
MPARQAGLTFGGEEKRLLAPKMRALIAAWTGSQGAAIQRGRTFVLYYKSAVCDLFESLGATPGDGLSKRVPTSLWRAPREAVLGYLSALFSADGTVSLSEAKKSCSIRLSGSSRALLQDVQLLLLNEGIVARLHLRRPARAVTMPDSKRLPRRYECAAQYELILDGASRDRFLSEIGFLLPDKQAKAARWIASKARRSNAESFDDSVASIEPAGAEDVYCTTEPETHSVLANGFTAAQCGEQPLLPWEPCNLGSLNLANFVTGPVLKGRFDFPRLKARVRAATRFLDDAIEVNDYPLPEIEAMAKGNRRIGLGVMGWAEALVKCGLAYDSPEALALADRVMSFVDGAAREASEELARERGVFPNWTGSVYDPKSPHFRGERLFPRHCARTTIAPTGTIAIAAGLQGAGIEPFFALGYTRHTARGLDALKAGKTPAPEDRFVEVNPLLREAGVEDPASLTPALRRVFATSHEVSIEGHLRMQAAFQKHTDNGVSKTINLPASATVEEVRKAYRLAYDLGLKGVTIYRDGSKAQQVLSSGAPAARPRRRVPEGAFGLSSDYYQIRTGYGPLHLHINYDERGPFQVFANIPPLGTEIAGLTSLVGILISKYLGEGGDPLRLLKHLNSVKGDKPVGLGPGRVDSIPHAIALALREHLRKTGWLDDESSAAEADAAVAPRPAEHCPKCFSRSVSYQSGCSGPTCLDCGHSECS